MGMGSLDVNTDLARMHATTARQDGIMRMIDGAEKKLVQGPPPNATRSELVQYYKDQGVSEFQLGKIKESAEEFEAIFLEIMLKSMRSTVPKEGMINGGNGEDVYRSMLDYEYAKSMAAQRGSGIAETIERQLLDAMIKQPKIENVSAGHAAYRSQAETVPLQESPKQGTIKVGATAE